MSKEKHEYAEGYMEILQDLFKSHIDISNWCDKVYF